MSHSPSPLTLLIYDRTAVRRLLGLSTVWAAGSVLYRARGLVDSALGVASFAEALDWLGRHRPEAPIAEVQYWGHGKWGDIRAGDERLDESALSMRSEHREALDRFVARLTPDSLFWMRTCETFGAERGQRFARALSERLGCRVAGHTYVIGPWQSGLHALGPGCSPAWDPGEGLAEGSARSPRRALPSSPTEPNTITFLEGRLPDWA